MPDVLANITKITDEMVAMVADVLETRSAIPSQEDNGVSFTQKCLIVILSFGLALSVSATDYVVPSGVTILKQQELLSQIIGNTFVGGQEETWIEYYEPSKGDANKGRFRGKHKNMGTYQGSWTIFQSLMCWEYEGHMSDFSECYTVEVTPKNVFLYQTDGNKYYPSGGRITMVSGNPYKL